MEENLKKLTNFIIFVAFVIVCFKIVLVFSGCTKSAYGEESKNDVVELVPESQVKSNTSWDKHWEAKESGEFKSSAEGVSAGTAWCLWPNSKCSTGIPKRLDKRMDVYGEWFREYAEGLIPEHIALTSTTEAPEGPGQCSPDTKLKECGLMGIKWTQAKACDVNVCNPEAAIACAAKGGNARRMAVLKKYPQLKHAPAFDQYVIGGLAGGIGGLATVIIKKSGALSVKADGALVYEHPYRRILVWVGSPKQKPTALVDKIQMGRITSYKMGLRVSRAYAALQIVMSHLGLITEYEKSYGKKAFEKVADAFEKIQRGPYKEVEIPDYLPKYPGDSLHGKCKKFPGMIDAVP